jgi:hypothetical protein
MTEKQELIDMIDSLAPLKCDNRLLHSKSIKELQLILAQAIEQFQTEHEDKLLEIEAERAVNRAIHELNTRQAHEPQRQAEAALLEKSNRRVFAEAAKALGFSNVEANYSVLVQALETLSVFGIREFLSANTTALVQATPTELQEREAERIKQHNQMLLNASPLELKELARQEAEQRRQAAQRAEQERQIAGREVADAAFGFPPLPETNQTTGEKIDAAYLTRISNTNLQLFKNFIRKHGAANVTARLRGIR